MKDNILKRRDIILNGSLWHAIMMLAIPVAINEFIRAMYTLVDTLFVSYIGSMEIAAITFVGPLNNIIRAISLGLSIGGTNLIAREIARANYDKGKKVALQLLAIAIALGGMIAIGAFVFSKEILLAASATEGILDIGNIYFRITVISSPFVFINSIYIAIKRADGGTLKAMNVNVVAMGFKVILTYVMIFHLNMGVISLAISTIFGTMFVSVYALYDLFFRKSLMQLSLKNFKMNKEVIWALLVISIPIIIEKTSVSFSFVVMNKYVISYGEKVLAGYGITNRINSLFFATVSGFGSGLAPIISQNLAAGQDERARQAYRKTLTIALGIAVTVISLVLPFRYILAGIFAKGDTEVLNHTVNAMMTYSISVIPWAVVQITSGVFQGTGHTKYNMIISIVRIYLFRIPVVILFSTFSSLGEYSIWYGMLISNVLTGALAFCLYLMNRKDLRLSGE